MIYKPNDLHLSHSHIAIYYWRLTILGQFDLTKHPLNNVEPCQQFYKALSTTS